MTGGVKQSQLLPGADPGDRDADEPDRTCASAVAVLRQGIAQGGVDLSWGSKGQILMDGRTTDSLRIVPAAGGQETRARVKAFTAEREEAFVAAVREDAG